MPFTMKEMGRRQRAISQLLESERLEALFLIGDENRTNHFCGDLRYYTNHLIFASRSVALIFPNAEPVILTGSENQRKSAAQRGFIKDSRVSEDFLTNLIALLRERRISTGRIGVNLEMLPTVWYIRLRQEFPHVEWVETHERIIQIRSQRSQEEIDIYRKGAALGDGGFEAALKVIRPGVTEYEVAAEIEQYARARGAEGHFTLLGSGKFKLDNSMLSFPPPPPSSRQIEFGDSVSMEISPRYEGYWTQLVRTANVGRANSDLEKIHRICCNTIRKGLEEFRPGKTIKDVVLAMKTYVIGTGYLLAPPLGHISGIDLLEGRVAQQNEMVLEPGMSVILHPTVSTPDNKSNFFWGETYLVTHDGYERLHRTGDELLTL
jgi:Xaa-Pro aminopeptidase